MDESVETTLKTTLKRLRKDLAAVQNSDGSGPDGAPRLVECLGACETLIDMAREWASTYVSPNFAETTWDQLARVLGKADAAGEALADAHKAKQTAHSSQSRGQVLPADVEQKIGSRMADLTAEIRYMAVRLRRESSVSPNSIGWANRIPASEGGRITGGSQYAGLAESVGVAITDGLTHWALEGWSRSDARSLVRLAEVYFDSLANVLERRHTAAAASGFRAWAQDRLDVLRAYSEAHPGKESALTEAGEPAQRVIGAAKELEHAIGEWRDALVVQRDIEVYLGPLLNEASLCLMAVALMRCNCDSLKVVSGQSEQDRQGLISEVNGCIRLIAHRLPSILEWGMTHGVEVEVDPDGGDLNYYDPNLCQAYEETIQNVIDAALAEKVKAQQTPTPPELQLPAPADIAKDGENGAVAANGEPSGNGPAEQKPTGPTQAATEGGNGQGAGQAGTQPQPASAVNGDGTEHRGLTASQVRAEIINVSPNTLGKYADIAGVPRPSKGQRNHRYTLKQIECILNAVIKQGENNLVEQGKIGLKKLKDIAKIPQDSKETARRA